MSEIVVSIEYKGNIYTTKGENYGTSRTNI